uniref:Protein kinase domain-containing protein n=1 Tax=Anser cygnoides TaxID=8845 RepID=A0A8B9E6Q1_ANSCY
MGTSGRAGAGRKVLEASCGGGAGALWDGGAGRHSGHSGGCAVPWGWPLMSSLGSSPCRAQGAAGAGTQAPPASCPCPSTGLPGLLGPHPASVLTVPAPGREPPTAPCLRQKVPCSPWAAPGWPQPQSAPHISAHLPSHLTPGPGPCSPSDPTGTFQDLCVSLPAGEEAFEYCDVVINTQEKVSDVYTQLEKLGEGKFGTVYRLQEKASGRIRAGKYFRTRTAKEKQAARAEVELMNLLHHPRLVQCLAAFQGPAELVMVMEYVAGGELFERIVDDDFEHTEPSSTQYMRQILEGLQYMHGQAVVHLDLKPENIVCVSPSGHWLKIADFGLARKLDTPVKVLHGTPEFMAPEVVSFEPVGFATDMWSVGVICYILLSGESPFQGDTDMETLSNITAAQWDFEEETFSDISPQAKDFISQLLQKDPGHRLSSSEALLHPWLQQPLPSSTKALPKERIKQFLARRKWQKTGKALLALNRLALLSQGTERRASEAQDEEGDGPEALAPMHPINPCSSALSSPPLP